MENINSHEGNLKKVIILIFVLSATMITQVFGGVNNTKESNDIDLELAENKQVEMYESLISEIDELKENLNATRKELNEKLTYQMRCNEEAIRSVNTSLSGASYALTIFGVIVGSFGIIVAMSAVSLGVYIGIQARRVGKLTTESRAIYETHLQIRSDVEQLDKNIKENMRELYMKLKKEETKALVERLVKVPEDIVNLFDNLVSREIPDELYSRLKEAYQKVKGMEGSKRAKSLYSTLFFQHFPALVLFEEDLENEIEKHYVGLMGGSFKNDIIQTSCEFLRACTDKGILNYHKKIKGYFIALSKSKHKYFPKLYKEIYKTLSTKENRFNLYSILCSEEELNEITKIYGQHMLTDYKDASGNTESEKLVLKEIQEEAKPKGDTKR